MKSRSKKSTPRVARRSGFGQAVIDSLHAFLTAAERDEPMTTRMVRLDLKPGRYTAADIKRIRRRLNVSQAMFARLMAVSVKLVQAWEAGTHKPSGPANRLLDAINGNPQDWLKRQFERTAKKRAG